MKQFIFLCAILLLCNCRSACMASNIPSEEKQAKHWIRLITTISPALSFDYGGEPSADIFARSARHTSHSTDSAGVTRIKSIFDDAKTGLRCTIEATIPQDLPAVEYATIENRSKDTSALFTHILASDIPVQIGKMSSNSPYEIMYSQGTRDRYDDFSLHDTTLNNSLLQKGWTITLKIIPLRH